MWDWLVKLGGEVWAAFGLTGLIVAGLQWKLALSYGQVGRFLHYRWVELRRWPTVAALPERVMVVISCLDGDDAKDTHQHMLADALNKPAPGLQPVLGWVRIAVTGTDQVAALGAAHRRANEVARNYRAPVVVWGKVTESGKGLALHFQGAGSTISRRLNIDRGTIEAAVREPLDSILSALAGAAVLEAAATAEDDVRMLVGNRRQFIADRLDGPAERIERALSEPGLAFEGDRRASLLLALGNSRALIGEQREDKAALRDAIAAYRAALEDFTRERFPLKWAATQNNLGNALQTLGKPGDEASLREAVVAYRAALEEYRRDSVPLDWAMTKNNLGLVLRALGELGDDQALRDAVAAYRESLEERRRDLLPIEWAETHHNLGNTLCIVGERGDDAALCDAIAAYRAALEVFVSVSDPRSAAATRQSLAHAEALLRSRGLEPPT